VEPTSLIISALTAGATATHSGTASAATRNSCHSLRAMVRRRLARGGDPTRAEAALQAHEADPVASPSMLAALLIATGPPDPLEVAAAQQILASTSAGGRYTVDASQARGVMFGDHNTQHNTFH
jgi:hypothetical protein